MHSINTCVIALDLQNDNVIIIAYLICHIRPIELIAVIGCSRIQKLLWVRLVVLHIWWLKYAVFPLWLIYTFLVFWLLKYFLNSLPILPYTLIHESIGKWVLSLAIEFAFISSPLWLQCHLIEFWLHIHDTCHPSIHLCIPHHLTICSSLDH